MAVGQIVDFLASRRLDLMAEIWAIAEIAEGVPTKLSLELATLARQLAEAAGGESRTVLIGGGCR